MYMTIIITCIYIFKTYYIYIHMKNINMNNIYIILFTSYYIYIIYFYFLIYNIYVYNIIYIYNIINK